jgi:PIN domain nuclease of toxin-antitoxin system
MIILDTHVWLWWMNESSVLVSKDETIRQYSYLQVIW